MKPIVTELRVVLLKHVFETNRHLTRRLKDKLWDALWIPLINNINFTKLNL